MTGRITYFSTFFTEFGGILVLLSPFTTNLLISDGVTEPEISKNILAIIIPILSIFAVSELVFDLVSALISCGVSTGYLSIGMPLASKWVPYSRDRE